ncbi:hypothetical protein [Deinococcus misasensis]|uniref:hypothetical protein n=1 Tax=Deinococcus misasensis TaxID=392413 RepID=UPI00055424CB|nr:hypothetical protein [Deinococcus misasensis]
MVKPTQKIQSEYRKLNVQHSLGRISRKQMMDGLQDLLKRHGDVLRSGQIDVLDRLAHQTLGEQINTHLQNLTHTKEPK